MIFDYDKLLESAGGDKELVDELISIFKSDCHNQLEAIKKAIDESNPKLLHETAHQLKGPLSSMGAYSALDLVIALETMGINEEMVKAKTGYGELVICIDELILSLASLDKVPTR